VNRYQLSHVTRYEYETPVVHAHHLAHLRPRELPWQQVKWSEIQVVPAEIFRRNTTDYFGNGCDWVEVFGPHDLLEIHAKSEVTLNRSVREQDVALLRTAWEDVAQLTSSHKDTEMLREYAFDSPLLRSGTSLRDYARTTFSRQKPIGEAILEFNKRIHAEFSYDPRVTDVTTPVLRVLREKRGVCQDFAHLAIACLRSLGLAARYVSGYLETTPPPGQPRLVGADASHAWAAVYVPEFGWLDFDPTNALLPAEQHVTLAWGRDFADVSPFKGFVLGGGAHTVTVAVDLARMPVESPTHPPASSVP
jgi:transglutaminase-like putative cysteine protease